MHRQIISQLQEILGDDIYLVGGSVRDILLGQIPKDFDFTTSLFPEIVEQKIRDVGKKPYLIGKKFGTIGLKLGSEYVEITTMRGEEYDQQTKNSLSKSRKPTVNFVTNLKEDLSRRDFTINALAMSINGEIIDYFGGKTDLENKILKCVGVPKQRFKEDPLRILRAIRFAGKLNLEIEVKTWEYICKMKWELFRISKERWVGEIDKILGEENPINGLNLLMKSGVLGVIVPELILQKNYEQNSPWHDFDLWTHTCKVVGNVPKENLDLRWSALLHDIAKPFTRTENLKGHSNYINHDILGAEMSLKVSAYFKFSNARRDYIFETILNHLKEDSVLRKYDNMSKKHPTD